MLIGFLLGCAVASAVAYALHVFSIGGLVTKIEHEFDILAEHVSDEIGKLTKTSH